MAQQLGKLVHHTALYAIGNAVVKLSGLLLAPLYLDTSLLSQAALGHYELLLTTGQFLELLAGLGLAQGLLKYLTDPSHEDHWPHLPRTALVASVACCSLIVLALWGVAEPLSRVLVSPSAPPAAFQIMVVAAGLRVVGQIPYTILRTEERVGWFVLAKIAEMVVLIGAAYGYVALAGEGLLGFMKAYLWSAALSTSVLLLGTIRFFKGQWVGRLVRPLVVFGMPLVVAGLASRVLNMGDRYLINWLLSAEDVALYGWASRLGGVVNMLVVQSVQLSFSVLGLKALGAGSDALHRSTFKHYAIWGGWMVLGVSLLSYTVTSLIADPVYLQGDTLVFPISLGFWAFGFNVLLNNTLYALGETRVIGIGVALAAFINIVLNVLLIPGFGVMGAALATTLAYGILAAFMAYHAGRRLPIAYPWSVAFRVLFLMVALYLLTQVLVSLETVHRLVVVAGMLILYWPFVLILRVYSLEELGAGLEAIRTWLAERAGGKKSP